MAELVKANASQTLYSGLIPASLSQGNYKPVVGFL